MSITVKVNNSTDSVVRVFDIQPIISWDFDEITNVIIPDGQGGVDSIEIVDQVTYELRIGTSSAGQGTSSFVGDIVNTGVVVSKDRQYLYAGALLVRGWTYYGQVRVNDEAGNVSSWDSFTFKYNSLPTASSATISPSAPSVDDDLTLSYIFSDIDSDTESGTLIRWFKNGEHQRHLDNLKVVEKGNLEFGDVWQASVLPSDGYEYGSRIYAGAVSIAVDAPVVSGLSILPENPNTNDILKAAYAFSSDMPFSSSLDKSLIRWIVNGETLTRFNDMQSVRLPVNAGDDVRVMVTPSDGSQYGATMSSEVVTIQSPLFTIKEIKVEGKDEPLSVLTKRPVITWDMRNVSGSPPTYINIRIGRVQGDNSILDETISGQLTRYQVPEGILHKGNDYYVSIAGSNSLSFQDYKFAHFRISGSHWENTVSNTTGWTFETSFLINDASEAFDEAKYQVISFEDGSRFAEVRIYVDRISLVSTDTTYSSVYDFSEGSKVLTVHGQGSNIKVYVNSAIAIDGTGLFTQISSTKKLKAGLPSSDVDFSVSYRNFYYATSGAYAPTSSSYEDMVFHTIIDFKDSEVVGIEGIFGDTTDDKIAGVNPNDEKIGGSLYKIGSVAGKRYPTVNRSYSPINRISLSPNKKYAAFAHARGVTIFNSYYISDFDHELDFSQLDDPQNYLWELTQNVGNLLVERIDSNGLLIDTSFDNIGRQEPPIG